MKVFGIAVIFVLITANQTQSGLPDHVSSLSWLSFYESIDRKPVISGLVPLRNKKLESTEIEIRIWSGFGLLSCVWGGNTDGIVFTYGERGFTFHHYPCCPGMGYEFRPSIHPDKLWSLLMIEEIFDLPDENELDFYNGILDGVCYVVEYKINDWFSNYHYCNPNYFDLPETRKMSDIVSLLKKYTPMDSLPCIDEKW